MIDRLSKVVFWLVVTLIIISAGITIHQAITAQRHRDEQLAQQTEIAKESQAHIDCIAKLFARFTRDNMPLTIKDLDKCQAEATRKSKPTSTQSSPKATPKATSPAKTKTPSPSNDNGGGNPSPPPEEPPEPEDDGLIPDNIPIIGPLL